MKLADKRDILERRPSGLYLYEGMARQKAVYSRVGYSLGAIKGEMDNMQWIWTADCICNM